MVIPQVGRRAAERQIANNQTTARGLLRFLGRLRGNRLTHRLPRKFDQQSNTKKPTSSHLRRVYIQHRLTTLAPLCIRQLQLSVQQLRSLQLLQCELALGLWRTTHIQRCSFLCVYVCVWKQQITHTCSVLHKSLAGALRLALRSHHKRIAHGTSVAEKGRQHFVCA